jgi:uncharacterized protein (DUF2267 family)
MDREVNVAMEWIVDADNEIGWSDRQKTYQAMRSTLHALRDRLTLEEAADLGAQLPTFLRGVYFEGFQPNKLPNRVRDVQQFLDHIRDEFKQTPIVDAEMIAQKVFRVLSRHVSAGEIDDVRGMLPEDFQYLWEGESNE